MSLQACANIVAKGDPERFSAAMAAPVEARRVLFPIYAFNVEVSRAPWVASEPMIGEMRLQWWRDALDEIAAGTTVRRHEVVTPLCEALEQSGARLLDELVAARRWDLYRDPFEDDAHFDDYLDKTSGVLMWVAARALGASPEDETAVRAYGKAAGLARFLKAVRELEDRGRVPLLDGRQTAVQQLAARDLRALSRPKLVRSARSALLEGWQTASVLKQIARQPHRVAEGTVGHSPFASRARLVWASFQ